MTAKARRFNLLTLYGLGYLPYSASLASLLAIAGYIALRSVGTGEWLIAILLVVLAAATAISSFAHVAFTSEDPHEAVIDEFLAMFACVAICGSDNPIVLLALFVIFRVLDNIKPFPLSWIDTNVHGALGFLADDLAICVPLGVIALAILVLLKLA